jgi:hypothetical protein
MTLAALATNAFYSFLLVDMNGPTNIPAAIFNPRRI